MQRAFCGYRFRCQFVPGFLSVLGSSLEEYNQKVRVRSVGDSNGPRYDRGNVTFVVNIYCYGHLSLWELVSTAPMELF